MQTLRNYIKSHEYNVHRFHNKDLCHISRTIFKNMTTYIECEQIFIHENEIMSFGSSNFILCLQNFSSYKQNNIGDRHVKFETNTFNTSYEMWKYFLIEKKYQIISPLHHNLFLREWRKAFLTTLLGRGVQIDHWKSIGIMSVAILTQMTDSHTIHVSPS